MSKLNRNLRLRRLLWCSLPAVVLCLALGLGLAHQRPPQATPLYESSAEIKLADANGGLSNTNLLETSNVLPPFNKAGAKVALLKSPLLVDKALQSLPFAISTYREGETGRPELYAESPFLVAITQEDGQWDNEVFKLRIAPNGRLMITTPAGGTIWGRLGHSVHVPGLVMVFTANKTLLRARPTLALAGRYEFVRHSPTGLMSDVLDQLDVATTEKDGAVVRVSYRSPVPEKAADLVNALTEVYMAKKTEAGVAKAASISSQRIISQGTLAVAQVGLNQMPVLAVVGLLALVGGTVLVYLFARLRSRPTDALAVQKESGLPLLASLPNLDTPSQQLSFFRQLAMRLELKGLLAMGNKVVVSSFTGAEGQTFFFEHLRVALAAQAKKVRAIRIESAESLNPDALATELMLVHNQPLAADNLGLAVMAGAAVNLVLIDSRTTPLHRLRELEQLVAEYQLPNVFLCLNREGYRPSLRARLWKRPARQATWVAAAETARAGMPATA